MREGNFGAPKIKKAEAIATDFKASGISQEHWRDAFDLDFDRYAKHDNDNDTDYDDGEDLSVSRDNYNGSSGGDIYSWSKGDKKKYERRYENEKERFRYALEEAVRSNHDCMECLYEIKRIAYIANQRNVEVDLNSILCEFISETFYRDERQENISDIIDFAKTKNINLDFSVVLNASAERHGFDEQIIYRIIDFAENNSIKLELKSFLQEQLKNSLSGGRVYDFEKCMLFATRKNIELDFSGEEMKKATRRCLKRQLATGHCAHALNVLKFEKEKNMDLDFSDEEFEEAIRLGIVKNIENWSSDKEAHELMLIAKASNIKVDLNKILQEGMNINNTDNIIKISELADKANINLDFSISKIIKALQGKLKYFLCNGNCDYFTRLLKFAKEKNVNLDFSGGEFEEAVKLGIIKNIEKLASYTEANRLVLIAKENNIKVDLNNILQEGLNIDNANNIIMFGNLADEAKINLNFSIPKIIKALQGKISYFLCNYDCNSSTRFLKFAKEKKVNLDFSGGEFEEAVRIGIIKNIERSSNSTGANQLMLFVKEHNIKVDLNNILQEGLSIDNADNIIKLSNLADKVHINLDFSIPKIIKALQGKLKYSLCNGDCNSSARFLKFVKEKNIDVDSASGEFEEAVKIGIIKKLKQHDIPTVNEITQVAKSNNININEAFFSEPEVVGSIYQALKNSLVSGNNEYLSIISNFIIKNKIELDFSGEEFKNATQSGIERHLKAGYSLGNTALSEIILFAKSNNIKLNLRNIFQNKIRENKGLVNLQWAIDATDFCRKNGITLKWKDYLQELLVKTVQQNSSISDIIKTIDLAKQENVQMNFSSDEAVVAFQSGVEHRLQQDNFPDAFALIKIAKEKKLTFAFRDFTLAYKIFGNFLNGETYDMIKAINSGSAVTEEMKKIGVSENGESGVKQLGEIFSQFKTELLKENSDLGVLKTAKFFETYFKNYISFDKSQFGQHDPEALRQTIITFEKIKNEIRQLPKEYAESGPIAVVEKNFNKQNDFKYSKQFLARYETLAQSINESLALIKKEKPLSILAKQAEAILEELRIKKTQTQKPEIIFSLDKKISNLEKLDFRNIKSFQDNYASLAQYKEFHELLRQLTFFYALHKHRNYREFAEKVSMEKNREKIPIKEVSQMIDFIQHIVTEETWKKIFTNELAIKAFENIVKIKDLTAEYINAQDQENSGMANLEFVPTRGILMEFSGHIADVCWASKYDSIAKKFPNFISVTMVQDRNTMKERLAGAVFLIETTAKDGTPLLVIRGLNPIPSVVDALDCEDFYKKFIAYAETIAQKIGRKLAIVIDNHSGGAGTNRPVLFACMQKNRTGEEVVFSEDNKEIDFNSYNLNDGVKRINGKIYYC
jgi:hypothetical protein